MPSDPRKASWAPNVYATVLVLRGRVRQVPWYSFFQWGWRGPSEWWQAFRFEGRDYQAPSAMVALLSKGSAEWRPGPCDPELPDSIPVR